MRTATYSPHVAYSMDCSLFLSWNQKKPNSENETAVIFLSLIATVKLQPVLNDSLEAKVVKFLEYVDPEDLALTDAFRSSFTSFSDESFTKSINSVKVLLSSCNQAIIAASMKMLDILIRHGSPKLLLALVKANLPLQLIITLNPLSLSFAKTVEIHTGLVNIIRTSLWLSTPYGLEYLKIEDHAEQQAVHKTVLQQVLAPSEQYIHRLCVNRYSIEDHLSDRFVLLLVRLLEISLHFQPTKEFVLDHPVVVSIPSCLAFFEFEFSICNLLTSMEDFQRKWNKNSGVQGQMWKTMHRMLRMESIEDVSEERLRNDRKASNGIWVVVHSIDLNNLLGMNLPKLW